MRSAVIVGLVLLGLSHPVVCFAQRPDPAVPAAAAPTPPNEFDLGSARFRVGATFLMDHNAFDQDDASREQASAITQAKLRDTRILFSVRSKGERPLIVQTGLMFEASSQTFRFRQTGVNIPLPEPWGRVFVGRTKEGTSLNKVLVGTYGWTLERFTFSDVIPILADGVRWSVYLPKQHLFWNVGYYTDWQSKAETFSTYENHAVARVAYVKMDSDTTGNLLHAGMNGRIGKPENGQLQLRSRPEAFAAPYFLDTGVFPAKESLLVGPEVYYRNGSWLFGSEYYVMKVDAEESGDPLFHGGNIFVSWLATDETRAYNTEAGTFLGVIPTNNFSKDGWGAWEAGLMFSYSDFTDGTLDGGTFWRISPTLNWHLSRSVRFEVGYGYGVLDRLGIKGGTQFFQSRVQFQI